MRLGALPSFAEGEAFEEYVKEWVALGGVIRDVLSYVGTSIGDTVLAPSPSQLLVMVAARALSRRLLGIEPDPRASARFNEHFKSIESGPCAERTGGRVQRLLSALVGFNGAHVP